MANTPISLDVVPEVLLTAERAMLQCLYYAHAHSSNAVNDTLHRLSEFMKQHQRQCRDARRERDLVTCPAQVLARIFEHLSLKGRCAFANTCRTFRTVGLSLPHLWSQISPVPVAFPGASRILERCTMAGVPVHITIILRDPNSLDALAHFLSRISDSIEYLDLSFNPPFGNDERIIIGWSHVDAALSAPYPLLHTLYLACWPPFPPQARLSPGLLSSEPGKLRTCSLSGIRLASACPALSLVTTFDYLPYNTTGIPLNLDSIFAIVPMVETLGLHALYASAKWPGKPPTLPKSLMRLAIEGEHSRDLIRSLDSVDNVIIIKETIQNYQPTWPDPVDVFILRYGDMVVRFGPGESGQRTVFTFFSGWTDCTLITVRIVYLTVQESIFALYGPPPAMPQLLGLTIQLATCGDYRLYPDMYSQFENLVGMFCDTSLHFECPALQTLHISAPLPERHSCVVSYPGLAATNCSCKNGGSLAFSDVLDFVNQRMHFQAPRLTTLIFSGIQHFIDIDMPAALGALSTVATTIEFLPKMPKDMQRWMDTEDIDESLERPTDAFHYKAKNSDNLWDSYGPKDVPFLHSSFVPSV